MRYVSTRGKTPPMDFGEAVLTGLAPDGGLLLPHSPPNFRSELPELQTLDYLEFSARFVSHFGLAREDANSLIRRAYASFDREDVVRFESLGQLRLMELFHGPTLAFKDIALQFLGHVFEMLLARTGGVLNILGATSGDTGSAAIHAAKGRARTRIFMLYPRGRVSRLQERQMVSVDAENVSCLSVDGSFDDCQALVKTLFADLAFKEAHSLGAVNSVNWARILAQAVYYGYASLKIDASAGVVPVVPTGNFGNIFSGYLAMRMGFPISRLVLATNDNDILARFFATGVYKRGSVQHTESPSMDIQSASNLERFLYYLFGEDGERVTWFMKRFHEHGEARLEPAERDHLNDAIRGVRITSEAMRAAIKTVYDQHGYVLDPHSAIGVAAAHSMASELGQATPVCMATAHPAKFPETIDQVIGEWPRHPRLDALVEGRGRVTEIPADLGVLKAHIESYPPLS
ncbi:MAG: threonine synthase [Gammaproteobacteria bacterium]|nr:threonine synthase [Gammaproteobacteria bacterium]